jgi:hypothetical protein
MFDTDIAATHKFSLDQAVVFTPGTDDAMGIPIRCRITRRLPKEGAEYQYHVASSPDGQQRRVLERQLRVAAMPT